LQSAQHEAIRRSFEEKNSEIGNEIAMCVPKGKDIY